MEKYMTDKIRLITLGLSLVLLSACGSSSSGDGGAIGVDNTTAVAEESNSIVGTWSSGCVNYNDFGESLLETYTFNADGSGSYSFSEYDTLDCNDADKILAQNTAIHYTVGNETTANDSVSAKELYTLPTGGGKAYFSMFRLDGNILYIASSEESGRDGYSAETRENDFSDVYPYFKQ